MTSCNILVVDDEIGIRELLGDILRDEGHHVRLAENAKIAREERLKQRPDLILLDIWMPDCDGISLLKEWANAGLLTMPVIMMSGHGTIDTAIEATKLGAFDFLEKPISLQKLLKTINLAIKRSEVLPRAEINLSSLGDSPAIKELKQRLEQLVQNNSSLLLIGNHSSVTLCAKFLCSKDADWQVLTDYTKLVSAPLDLLERHHDSVIFIEEVTQLSKTEQKGLLLIISKAEKTTTQIICASQYGIPTMIEKDMLTTPLLQTLAGVAVRVPSLNEHKEDIPGLVTAMSTLMVENCHIAYKTFDTAALNRLRNAEWHGDLQELESVVQNLILTSLGSEITLNDVERVLAEIQVSASTLDHNSIHLNLQQPLREARDDFERFYFHYHMQTIGSNIGRRLSEVSGLERTHLYRKLKQLGINIKN